MRSNSSAPHHFPLNPVLDRGHFAEHVGAQRRREPEGLDHFEKLGGQAFVARHTSRLDEHHALPRLAPLRVIIFVAFERTRQRSGVALRPQPQVNAEQKALRRHPRNLGGKRLGELVEKLVIGQRRTRLLPGRGRLFENLAFIVVKKQHVHVGTVIEFLPAELAHAEHAKFRRQPVAFGVLMIRLGRIFRKTGAGKCARRC